jgi:hypothetical protein
MYRCIIIGAHYLAGLDGTSTRFRDQFILSGLGEIFAIARRNNQ